MISPNIASTWFDSQHIRELRLRSQAYSAKEDLWSWFVLRRISIFVTVFFMKLKLSPNTISWMSAFFIVFSGFLLLQATPLAFILAFLSYNIGYLFDCVDGEVARLTKNTSKKGYFIDLLIQGATLPVFLAILISLMIGFGYIDISYFISTFMYLAIIIIIGSLFIPISYQLTFSSQQTQDPINQIRTRSFKYQLSGFILGLPGFFATLLIIAIIEVTLFPYYFLLFLTLMGLKTFLRLFITLRSF